MDKVKGIALIDVVKTLRVNRSAASKLLPPRLHPYLSSRIQVSDWYPEEDFFELLEALTRVVPDPGMDVWEWVGRMGAKSDFSDIYSLVIRQRDPLGTLQDYRRVWNLYHDSGEVEVFLDGPGRARVDIRHFLTSKPEFCRLQTGHIAEVVQLAGASRVDVLNTRISAGDRAARWQVRWTD